MNDVKVKRTELLDKLKVNREAHRGIFLDAQVGYREQAIREIEQMLQEARSGKRIRRAVSLIEPIDQTREYDRVIAMLEMSVDDVIELDEVSFRQYVLDDWSWKQQFLAVNSTYTAQTV